MTKNKKLKNKLTHKYILAIHSENSLEEKFSMRLNRLNVFIFIGTLSVFLIVSTILLIAFTPLKEYIPGYDPSKLRIESQNVIFKTDSLNNEIRKNQKYIDNLSLILSNKINPDSIQKIAHVESNSKKEINNSDYDFSITKEDSIFRTEIEIKDRYNIIGKKSKRHFILTAPISGTISEVYNSENKHFAVDIAAKEGTPVKAVADGTVVFAEWTSTTGNVIIIEHENHLISVYKHNALSTKEQGDFVEKGEVIAISGSTGELSSGPHLHFELWYNGYPVNPTDFINFEI